MPLNTDESAPDERKEQDASDFSKTRDQLEEAVRSVDGHGRPVHEHFVGQAPYFSLRDLYPNGKLVED